MAASSPSKRKPKLEPISLDELAADSTMTGFTSVFRIPTTETPLPHLISQPSEDAKTTPSEGDISPPPVADLPPTVGATPAPTPTLWQTDDGLLFPNTRARRIQSALDALSSPEERVYDTLWTLEMGGSRDDKVRHACIGYDRLAHLTKLNEKSVRRIIPRLIEKGFLEIEKPAESAQRIGTLYKVFSEQSVFAEQQSQGRIWTVRTGRGVFYVRPVTVDVQPKPTVGNVDAG
jgi:hypothetical protein